MGHANLLLFSEAARALGFPLRIWRKKQLSEAPLAVMTPLHRSGRRRSLVFACCYRGTRPLNLPDPGGFLEEKKLSGESMDAGGIQGMLSGRDRDLEAGHIFLHFISGVRTSCRKSRRSCLITALGILFALRCSHHFIKAFSIYYQHRYLERHGSRYTGRGKPLP